VTSVGAGRRQTEENHRDIDRNFTSMSCTVGLTAFMFPCILRMPFLNYSHVSQYVTQNTVFRRHFVPLSDDENRADPSFHFTYVPTTMGVHRLLTQVRKKVQNFALSFLIQKVCRYFFVGRYFCYRWPIFLLSLSSNLRAKDVGKFVKSMSFSQLQCFCS
jgi:hypothetical protein